MPEFEKKLKAVKHKLFPSIPPESWKIHMKEMWAGSSRKRHPVYRTLSFKDLDSFIHEFFVLIKKSNLFIYNIAVTSVQNNSANKKVQNQLRDEAYILGVLNAVSEWTTNL